MRRVPALRGGRDRLTSTLTPISLAIAVGCFAVLGAALVLIAVGLRPQAARLRLRVVALSIALVLAGAATCSVADLRLDAIATIFGLEGPGDVDLFGSWDLVELAGGTMACTGMISLAVTATVAVVRLRSALGVAAGE